MDANSIKSIKWNNDFKRQEPTTAYTFLQTFGWTWQQATSLQNTILFIIYKRYHTKGFPGGSKGKDSACNTGDLGSIPGLGRSPGEGIGNPLQYSCLENSTDREAWQATVHVITKSRTWPHQTLLLVKRDGARWVLTEIGHLLIRIGSSSISAWITGSWTTLQL